MAARNIGAATLISIALLATQAKRANAEDCDICHGGSSDGSTAGAIVAGSTILIVDIALSVHDLTTDGSSRFYGAAEIAIAAPQTLLGLGLTTVSVLPPLSKAGTIVFGLYTGWTVALTVHGIYSLLRPSPHKQGFAIVPTMVSDGVSSGIGIGAVGFRW